MEDSGKRLRAIVSPHGHGDHWFGTAMLLKRFPEAKAYATAGTIEVMRFHGDPKFRAATWDMGGASGPGYDGVTIRNGLVVGFPLGVRVTAASANHLVDLSVSDSERSGIV